MVTVEPLLTRVTGRLLEVCARVDELKAQVKRAKNQRRKLKRRNEALRERIEFYNTDNVKRVAFANLQATELVRLQQELDALRLCKKCGNAMIITHANCEKCSP